MPSSFFISLTEIEQNRINFITLALNSPQKHSLEVINDHVDRGGKVMHPQLGNLQTLAEEINRQWSTERNGIHLAQRAIEHYFPTISFPRNGESVDQQEQNKENCLR